MYIIFAENVAKKFVKHTSTTTGAWPKEARRRSPTFYRDRESAQMMSMQKQQVGSVKPLTASYAQRMRELKASDMRSVRGGF